MAKKTQLLLIQQHIHEIRGQKVMLDFDIAALYKVETKRLKAAVRRNKRRFPSDMMFTLTKKEWKSLRTKISSSNRGGTRYMPFAFTEHGVGMLSGVLKSEIAINMHLSIVRAFIKMRQFFLNYTKLTKEIKHIKETVHNHNEQLNQIYKALENLLVEKAQKNLWGERERIGFKRSN